jgi:hypothetical protein
MGCSEHINELPGRKKGGTFIGQLNDFPFLKNGYTQCCSSAKCEAVHCVTLSVPLPLPCIVSLMKE